MIKYAREDVHYLLYIYDRMRVELVKLATQQSLEPTQFLKSVLMKSKDICLQTYKKPRIKDEAYYNLVLRNKLVLSSQKLKILKKLLKWRFKIAALEDENPNYVLTNSMVFQLVEKQPKTIQELHSWIKRLNPLAKKYDKELIENFQMEEIEELSKKIEEMTPVIQETIEVEPVGETPATVGIPNIGQLFDENQVFHLRKTRVLVPDHAARFPLYETAHLKKTAAEKIAQIRGSFDYQNYVEYFIESNPEIKGIFQEIEQKQLKTFANPISEKKEAINEKNEGDEAKPIEFIGFSREKGEIAQKKSSQVALNIDQGQMITDLKKIKEVPKSLGEKYNISMIEKKGKNKRDRPWKKEDENPKNEGKTKNKFEVFEGDNVAEEELEKDVDKKRKVEKIDQDFEELSKKIMSKIDHFI